MIYKDKRRISIGTNSLSKFEECRTRGGSAWVRVVRFLPTGLVMFLVLSCGGNHTVLRNPNIVISHDHSDHFSTDTLAGFTPTPSLMVPLGLGDGVPSIEVVVLKMGASLNLNP